MPSDTYGAASASDGTYAYEAGGYSFSQSGSVNTFYRYDPASDTWTTLAPMGDAFSMGSAVYYPTTNKIYVFGGTDATTGAVNNLTRIYDIATDTWSSGANMPDVRAFMASGYNPDNGKIYLVSGYNTGDVTSAQPDVWEYDPAANTFTPRLPIPHAVGGAAFGLVNGHLYVAGGRDATNTIIDLVWDYDISANTWTQKTSMPSPNNVPGSGVRDGMVWAFGGGNPFSYRVLSGVTTALPGSPNTTGAAVAYDPAADSWSTGPSLHMQRSFVAGTNIADELVAAGGYNGSSTTTQTEVLGGGPPPPPPPPPPCDNNAVLNPGFETGSFEPWVIDGQSDPPVVTDANAHSGTYSALAGQPQRSRTARRQLVLPADHRAVGQQPVELLVLAVHGRLDHLRLAGRLHHRRQRKHPGDSDARCRKQSGVDEPDVRHDAVRRPDRPRQVPGSPGRLWRRHRHVRR